MLKQIYSNVTLLASGLLMILLLTIPAKITAQQKVTKDVVFAEPDYRII